MKAPNALTLFAMVIIPLERNGVAADATANWSHHCASCHGKNGKGDTTMGKKLGVKNYYDPKFQTAFSDAEMERAIKEGVKTTARRR